MNKRISKKDLIWVTKIAIGSALALVIARGLNLENFVSAGTIALLTMGTTRGETLRLAASRLLSFAFTVLISYIIFSNITVWWIAYGVFAFILLYVSTLYDITTTCSVNAVVGVHFLIKGEFTIEFIMNEFLLLLIGITIAIIFNMIHLNEGRKRRIMKNINHTEEKLQEILGELASFLINDSWTRDVWKDLDSIQTEIKQFRLEAYYHKENTFGSKADYYMDYFEMRLQQCEILNNLHSEVVRIKNKPVQAKVVADYMLYLKQFVVEKNNPNEQLARLYELLQKMRQEPLPVDRDEFEARAILYHILMDLEEFVMYKSKYYERFLEGK